MSNEMIVFLIDADNFSAPSWLDDAFRWLEAAEGTIAVRRAYGSVENLKGLSDAMRRWVIRPFVNLPLSKNTTDLSLAVDAMEIACQSPRPTLFVIGSGDVDFVPLVVRLRERGIRVVCVSERSKMAQDAVHAYDQVVYVGGDHAEQSLVIGELEVSHFVAPKVRSLPRKTVAKTLTSKEGVPKIVPTKKVAVKKLVAKKVVKKVPSAASRTVVVTQILAAAPNLNTGQWQPLRDVAKALHDEMLLAKNTTSTKLFKKYPHHFELMPAKQPNQVRYILLPT